MKKKKLKTVYKEYYMVNLYLISLNIKGFHKETQSVKLKFCIKSIIYNFHCFITQTKYKINFIHPKEIYLKVLCR